MISQRVPEVSQTSQRVPEPELLLQTSQRFFQAEMMWRLVGLASSVVGLLCNAWSPSFNCLIGGWNSFKFFLYGVLSLVLCVTILFAKQSSLSMQLVQHKTFLRFVVLMITSVYSSFYNKAVNGKPEMFSLVSNATFALVSLSLSKLIKFGFEMEVGNEGQAIHSSSDSEPEVDSAQVVHSPSNSEPDVGNGGQVIHSYSDSQAETSSECQVVHSQAELTSSECQVVHSSLDPRPEVGGCSQHVINIHT
ncbi:NB-ARC domain protein [Sesbania bispinosa]|nr:NB-ARC domain protein [Sesbania bispinosa]